MALYIFTGDGVVGYIAVDLYWGRCGRKLDERSLLGTERSMLKRMTLYISAGDGVVGYGAVYLYWRRCGRLPHCRSLLETVQ